MGAVSASDIKVPTSGATQSMLDSMNVPQGRDENKEYLTSVGGANAFLKLLGTNVDTGLSHAQVTAQRELFGVNEFPESPMDTFLELLWAAFMDTTLLILLAAAAVSLIIGAIEDPEGGWIEGCAIFIAVFLVANISAGNDYTKQLQFKALEASSADDERCSVLRDGSVERINPKEIVVGDILVLQVSGGK
jgi:magnesium-transporting ATPase (P-type)